MSQLRAADALPADWAQQASASLDARCRDALSDIRGADRRLLAIRGYLRAGDSLGARWSWQQQRIDAYAASDEGKQAAQDVGRVIEAFEADNPGYSLLVNRRPRSLRLQVEHWNENASVGARAAELVAALRTWSSSNRPLPLTRFLARWHPRAPISLAPPGLSAHGQARAFDFQITHAGEVIAGVSVAGAPQQWDAKGWTVRLARAVANSGGQFRGPLKTPYEPWHYDYEASGL